LTSRNTTHGAGKIRSAAGIGRTVVILAVVLVIFLVLALFIVLNPGEGGSAKLTDVRAVQETVEQAQKDYPQISGTAAEHLQEGQRLAAEGTGASAVLAYEEFRKVLALQPESPEALLGIATIYRYLERERIDFRVERALAFCDAVAEVYPNDPRPYRVKARISMDLKGYDGGVEAWTHVLVLYPDDEEAMVQLGRCLMELGRHTEAATQLEKAASVALEPSSALLILAENHRRGRAYGEAYAALDRASKDGRDAADAAVAAAAIFEEVGHRPMAREQIRIALRRDGNHSRALLHDAIYRYQDDGELDEAAENLLRILNQPDIEYEVELRDQAALHLGIVYRLKGDLQQADKYLAPLVARDSKNLPARFHMAKIALANGKGEEFVGPFALLLEDLRCSEPEPWLLLAQLNLQADNLEGTVGAYEKAIELRPDYYPAYFALIHILGEYKNVGEMRHLVKVLYHENESLPIEAVTSLVYFDPIDITVLEESLLGAAEKLEIENPGGYEHLELTALYYYYLGNREVAGPLFESLATKSRGDSLHWLYLGTMALRSARYDEASEHFTAALDESRTDALYLYLAGRMLEEEGRSEKAEETYFRLSNYHPSHIYALHGDARVKHRLGDMAGAAKAYEAAHKADPDFLPAWRDHLLLSMGEPLLAGTL